MGTKKLLYNKNTFYFCTITCFSWLHLFRITNLYDHIYHWFDILKSKKIFISGYVIMPNHLHLLLFMCDPIDLINDVIGTGKRFMAYEIVKRLKSLNQIKILERLSNSVSTVNRKRGKLHEIFESSFDLKEIVSGKFLFQKLNYIHNNPVSGKWKLVDDFTKYPHSSAGFYFGVESTIYKVIHYDEVIKFADNF